MTWVWLAACTPHDAEGPGPGEPEDSAQLDTDPPSEPSASTALAAGYDARMCVVEGVVHVVFLDDGLWATRSTDLGQTWSDPVQVDDADAEVWNADLSCDGTVLVAWEDGRAGENHQIYVDASTDGVTFGEDRLLESRDPDGTSMSLEPKIVGDGAVSYVAWYDSLRGLYDIWVAASLDGGDTWADPVLVDDGDGYSARPVLAIGPSELHVVWEDSRDGRSDVWTASSDDGARTFSADQRLDVGDAAGASDTFLPTVEADGDEVSVVWFDARGGDDRQVWASRSADRGATWSEVRVDEGAGNAVFAVSAMDGSTLHVAWQEDLGIRYRALDGGAEVDLGAGLLPQIAIGATVGVAWIDGDVPKVGFAPFDGSVAMAEGHGGEPTDLRFAMDGDRWFAVWTDLGEVWFATGTGG